MENSFTYEMQIKESHLDTFGHVNNATYLTILEEARWELITSRGFGLESIKKTGQGPVILEVKLRFKRELNNRDHIRIVTRAEAEKARVGRVFQQIYRGDELAAEAEFKIAFFDTRARKIIDPSPEWLHAIGLD